MDITSMKIRKKELKLTLDEISTRSGIPKRTIEDIFRGATKNPRVDTLQAIERALGLAPEPTDEEKALGMSRTAPIALSDKDKRRLTMLMEADEVLGEERVDMALSLIELSVEAEKNKK